MLVYRTATYAIYILDLFNSLLDLFSLGYYKGVRVARRKTRGGSKIFPCSFIGHTDFFLRSDGIAFVDET